VQGFGLKRGALGSSVAHDSHNLILAGTEPRELLAAAQTLERTGGGFVVIESGQVLAQLPLPFAGLISAADATTVSRLLEDLHAAARRLGCAVPNPFILLSFLALSVIPQLRITDQGLFDVERQAFVTL
jgi:adenine deaminase